MKRRQPEHGEQVALFHWAALHLERVPELWGLHAIPNAGGYKGGFRTNGPQVARALAGGVKKGYPDIGLDVARGEFHGLRCELKAPGELSRLSADQKQWRDFLKKQGYHWFVTDSWQVAWNEIVTYLGRPELRQPIYR